MDYTPDRPSNPPSYYLKLFTSEYQNSPKLKAFAAAFLNKLQDITDLVDYLSYYFDLDTAVGVQLDTIGQIVGQSRYVNFQPSDGSSPKLNDDNYRILLRCKILRNQWDGKIESLYDAWKLIFPSGTIAVQDNQDMSINIYLAGEFNSIIIDLISNGYVVPRPEGVLINTYTGNKPFFGFDANNDYIGGFDAGKWL